MLAQTETAPTTIRLTRAQLDQARETCKRRGTSLHAALRHGLQLYEESPEDTAVHHEGLDTMILVKLTRDDHAAIHRLSIATGHTYSAVMRQALDTATRHLAGQAQDDRPQEASHGA